MDTVSTRQMHFDATIVICTYNQSNTLMHVVNAIKQQTAEENYSIQLIIADDGSSADQVRDFISLTSKYNKSSNCRIKYVWQEDIGFQLAASRNNGIRLAESDVIIFIDGDCVPDPGFLKAHIGAHNKSDSVLCIGHRKFEYCANLSSLQSNEQGQSLKNELSLREEAEEKTIRDAVASAYPWKAMHGRNFSFRKPKQPIFFDENYIGWGCEDTTFAIDLYKAGYTRVIFERQACVTQYDDFVNSLNPYISLSSEGIACTMGNYLMLMAKHRNDPELFCELAQFLGKYAIPFCLENAKFVLNEDQKRAFFSREEGFSFEEASNIFTKALNTLNEFYNRNPALRVHPIIEKLNYADKNRQNQPEPKI